MTDDNSHHETGRAIFPGYWDIGDQIHAEIIGLTDQQLDWTSDQLEWSEWGVRRQVSHMASMLYRWMLLRWGHELFPNGPDLKSSEVTALAASDTDRALDENIFKDIDDITGALDKALLMAQTTLESYSIDKMRSLTIESNQGPHWDLMIDAHPTGIDRNKDTGVSTLTLEGTFRHMYFELVTHMFNIQRLKRAQGLEATVDLPKVGYYVLDGWDISEV